MGLKRVIVYFSSDAILTIRCVLLLIVPVNHTDIIKIYHMGKTTIG